jgi:hypothetical protein
MARFNVFEGSRRIALLIKVVWAIGAVAVGWTNSPRVSLEFSTSHPDAAFIRSDGCISGTDATRYISRPIDDGKIAYVELCFKAMKADSGELVVPYRSEGGRWWGNARYTPDVTAYTDARAKAFSLSEADREAAQEEWSSQRTENIRNGVLFAVGGWIVLSLLQMLVGWIVRGFLGIPYGRDRRPEPVKSADVA